MFTIELLKTQQATLVERERANMDLVESVEALSVEKRQADDNLASLHTELDHESTT